MNELAGLDHTQAQSTLLAADLRTLARGLERDVLSLAGPDRASRQELFDFIVEELHRREREDPSRIGAVRWVLSH